MGYKTLQNGFQSIAKDSEISLGLSPFIWAAVTKCHRLGGFYTTNIYFSHSWRLGSLRSGIQQVRCLLRAHFLVHTWPPFSCLYTVEGENWSLHALIKALISFMRAPPL